MTDEERKEKIRILQEQIDAAGFNCNLETELERLIAYPPPKFDLSDLTIIERKPLYFPRPKHSKKRGRKSWQR